MRGFERFATRCPRICLPGLAPPQQQHPRPLSVSARSYLRRPKAPSVVAGNEDQKTRSEEPNCNALRAGKASSCSRRPLTPTRPPPETTAVPHPLCGRLKAGQHSMDQRPWKVRTWKVRLPSPRKQGHFKQLTGGREKESPRGTASLPTPAGLPPADVPSSLEQLGAGWGELPTVGPIDGGH